MAARKIVRRSCLGARPRYNLVVDEDVKKPTKQTNKKGTVLVQMFPILLRLQRDTCTTALILLMMRGPSPSIVLYFQTEEGGAAKKN